MTTTTTSSTTLNSLRDLMIVEGLIRLLLLKLLDTLKRKDFGKHSIHLLRGY